MKKIGKYEKMRAKMLMRTYLTSLLCLVLCVAMFLGTSYAWFTSEVASEQNQLYVGVLDVSLHHSTFKGGLPSGYTEVINQYKILRDDIKWEPGYTAVEQFKLIEEGDLGFNYTMSIDCKFEDTENGTTALQKEEIAKHIEVWSYDGDAQSVSVLQGNFDAMTAEGWTYIGTLFEVIDKDLTVFGGQMAHDVVDNKTVEGDEVVDVPAEAYHMIALHMDDAFDGNIKDETGAVIGDIQGEMLNGITIKLVATQLPSEQDAFGSNYDNLVYVETKEQLQEALNNAVDGTTIIFAKDIEGDVVATQKENIKLTIDGKGNTLAGSITVNGQSARYDTAALTIKNVDFIADSITTEACVNLGINGDDNTRNTNHVTVSGCIFNVPGAVGVKSYTGGDLNVTIENCIAMAGTHSLAQLKNVETGLKVISCEVYSKNGICINNSPSMEMIDCKFEVTGYAVRFGSDENTTDESFTIRNSTLSAGCKESDDAVIVFRAGAKNAKLTLSDTLLGGTHIYLGEENANIIRE